MKKCSICHKNEVEYAWQPFGPDDKLSMFTLPGSHYRGFPVISVCQDCHDTILKILAHDPTAPYVFVFHFKKVGYYITEQGTVCPTPFQEVKG